MGSWITRFLILMANILLIHTASFSQAGGQLPRAEPDIRGVVTKVLQINPQGPIQSGSDVATNTIGTILIEENPEENWGSAKARVRITNKTKIFKRLGQDLVPAAFDELKIRQPVEAWFAGPVAESYPIQATGAVIVFLKSDGAVIDYATLIDHLRSAGASVEPFGKVSQAFFSLESQAITVNGGEVHVFEHADVAAADAEAEHISPDGSAFGRPPTTMVHWVATPHFYKTGRLIVLYLGDDTLVTRALEAGLGPQFAGK